ncbi:MAG: diguanylate cyclase domain-containing protein [Solirubrobacteraceae bacterium]
MTSDRLARAASAAEQLSASLWEVVCERAEAGDAQRAESLSRRVLEVCESFRAVATAGGDDAARAGGERFEGERAGGERFEDERAGGERFEDERAGGERFEDERAGGERFEDERAGGERFDGERLRRAGSVPAEAGETERRLASAALVDEVELSQQIELEDLRAGGGPPVSAALERRLERHAQDGVPFALLLVEVLDVERLRALSSNEDVLREIWAVESAIAEQLRPADTLLREIDGRWWLMAPDTGADAAMRLAERLTTAARRFAHRGAPLRVVIGMAVCPDDGLDVATLVGHADVDLYAAQAAGRSIGGGLDDGPRSA